MKWTPRGYGGERRPPEHIKREGWQAQRVLVIEADDERLTWPERELVRQLSPSFFLSAPAMAPLTVCGSQSRAFVISTMVAPSGCLSMVISRACLLSARGVVALVAAFGLVAPLVRAAFLVVRVAVEAFDMKWTLSMKRATTIAAR